VKRIVQILWLCTLAAVFVGCASTVEIDRNTTMALTEDSSGGADAKNKRSRVIVTGIEDEHGNKDAGDLGSIALGRLNSVIRYALRPEALFAHTKKIASPGPG